MAASDQLVAGWSQMSQVMGDMVAAYRLCSTGDTAADGDGQGPPMEQLRPLLVVAAQVADVLSELCADVLLHREPISPAVEYLQDAQDAADTLAQRYRWAAACVD
jgi:hypothetical protein